MDINGVYMSIICLELIDNHMIGNFVYSMNICIIWSFTRANIVFISVKNGGVLWIFLTPNILIYLFVETLYKH